LIAAKLVRALRCACERASERGDAVLAVNGLHAVYDLVRLLMSSDDAGTYMLARNAAEQATTCRRVVGSAAVVNPPAVDAPATFLERTRVNTMAAIIERCKQHRGYDVDAALRAVHKGFSALRRGVRPQFAASPSWFDWLRDRKQAGEAAGRNLASIALKSAAESFQTAAAAHRDVHALLGTER
jgi:hypothetical protein